MQPLLRSVLLLLLLGFLPACRGAFRGDLDPAVPVAGWLDSAPDFEALAGRPVVIEFWATWCLPCVQSTPHLVELHERYSEQGLFIAGIHFPEGAKQQAEIEAFVERFDIPYAIGLDLDGSASRAFGVKKIPRAFVFDKAGELAWDGHPMDPAFETAIQSAL